ncbi:MAG: sulfatase, partial [Bradymonadaceae bacterium]
MSMISKISSGWLYGLVFSASLLIAEGLYVALSEPSVALWMVPFSVGVGAPLGLLIALFAGLFASGWASLLPAQESLTATSKRWLWEDDEERLVARSAWGLTATTLLAIWTAISVFASIRISLAIATPLFAGLLLALIQIAALAMLVASSALIASIVACVLGRVSSLGKIGSMLVRPAAFLGLAAVAGAIAFAAAWAIAAATLEVLPWAFAVGPLVGALATVVAIVVLETRPSLRRTKSRALSAFFVVAALFTLFLPMKLETTRLIFVGQSSIVSTWYDVIHPRLDFDGDGSIFFYAGGDCAPFDPDRGPHQQEIIGDGIDQNCSGSDLVVNPEDFRPGRTDHPRPKGIADKPNIILITTDALTFTNTTVGGYERDTTPNLADWASRATVFESAFSNSTSTRLSMPGLLAGMFNSQIPMKNKRRHPYDYDESLVTIATMLKEKGYRTIHLPGTHYFVRWKGYWNGFDEVDTTTYKEAKDRDHTSPGLTDAAIRYLDEHDPEEGPIFLWIHYYDHHEPYVMPEGAKAFGNSRSNQDIFDSELHFADSHWARLMSTVEEKWEPEDYLMIFTSDHGEMLGDHGLFRKTYPYEASARVPLLVRGPGIEGGVVSDQPVCHED